MSELFTPPRFYQQVKFHRHTNRSIGWLELFYDLVYVATLIQIGNYLSDDVSLERFGQVLVLLVVVWWAWSGETFYQNQYVVDDLVHRLLVFTQIFAVATLGLSVSDAFGDLYVQFTLAYVIVRVILVLMYVRAARSHPESVANSGGYGFAISVSIFVWLGSLLLPADIHWVGWLVAIGFELSIPLFPALRQQASRWTVDVHHITERLGIFTIILLGESFVKILDDAQGTKLNFDLFIFSIFGLTVVYTLWWLYFSDTAGKGIDFSNPVRPVLWVYGHLPLAAGLVSFGVGAKKLFAAAGEYPDTALNEDYRMLYMSAIVLYLVALALIDMGIDDEQTHQIQNREAAIHFISAFLVAVVGFTMTDITPTLFVVIIAVIMVAQVVYSIYQTQGIPHDEVMIDEVTVE